MKKLILMVFTLASFDMSAAEDLADAFMQGKRAKQEYELRQQYLKQQEEIHELELERIRMENELLKRQLEQQKQK